MDIHQRLSELNLTLPSVAAPLASYVPAVQVGETVWISGQLPIADGALLAIGKVPSAVSVPQAQQAAQQCVLNGLAALDQLLVGDWARLQRVVRLGVFVNSEPEFDAQHQVANGASDLIGQLFDDAGVHARSAMGAAALPRQAAVEVEMQVIVHSA
jgi:enamine deaminase RidA (YjgF/YER057c/UK114 family)